ncbi:MAG TPA: ABC transporter permease [Streptosporangiaceae bacterium]|nr:ABC transporter permease [Streptosporangiaceae bacterium]
MRDSGRRMTAPGDLLDAAVLAPEGEDTGQLPDGSNSLAEMAAQYGLRPSSARPGLISYLRLLWQRRHFIVAYATARNVSMYTEARLGQLWQVLTPLLNSAVYYLIFGVIFEANRGIQHYPAFLVIGVFIFSFTERSIVVGSTCMRANIQLIRALYFPRACLPLAYVLVEFQQLALSMLVVFAIVLGSGEPITVYWLLLLPALVLQGMFNVGAALLMARLGAGAQDFSELIPFLTRIWRYFCGVMYSVTSLPSYATLPTWAKDVITLNPAAVYISLARYALMATIRADAPGAKPYNAAACAAFQLTKHPPLQAYCHPTASISELWLAGIGWAVVTLVVGAVYFWQAETRYGRG